VDLVILNEKETSYIQELQRSLEAMVSTSLAGGRVLQENRGRIFVLRADLLSLDERLLLQTAARVVLAARDGSLTEQVIRMRRQEQRTVHPARRQFPRHPAEAVALEAPPLEFFNGRGGFTEEGREYVIVLGKGKQTPAPWIRHCQRNWFPFPVGRGLHLVPQQPRKSAHPWSNDPVSDPSGGAISVTATVRHRESTALPIC
jgi:cyclic beta-1,2-glucan synthetase